LRFKFEVSLKKRGEQNFRFNFLNIYNFHSKDSDVMVRTVYCLQPKKCYNDCLLSTNCTYSCPLEKTPCVWRWPHAYNALPRLKIEVFTFFKTRHSDQPGSYRNLNLFKGLPSYKDFHGARKMLFRIKFPSC